MQTKIDPFFMALLGCLMLACTTIEGGECTANDESLEWYFITQSGATGTLKKCVVCNFGLASDAMPTWIEDNAGSDYLSMDPSYDDILPCLYTALDPMILKHDVKRWRAAMRLKQTTPF